jgi:hypothetical protein
LVEALEAGALAQGYATDPCAAKSNTNRLVPVGPIAACMATPLIAPVKLNGPKALAVLVPVKEPAGMVVEKVPIWRVTASAGGLIPLLVLPKVKLDRISKESVFGVVPKWIVTVGLKAANCTGGTNPVPASLNIVPKLDAPPLPVVP